MQIPHMVKDIKNGPFTAITRVQIPSGTPNKYPKVKFQIIGQFRSFF